MMFERFPAHARRAVVWAQEEARMLNHDYIGTEHFLLGLIHETDGVAAQSLQTFGITLEDARSAVENTIGRGRAPSLRAHPVYPRSQAHLGTELARSAAAQPRPHRHRAPIA